ncbi:hypothetical protein [Amycolatopsis sp. cmx-11-51]|uniref:hypothetical protein n=1 Tax=Amycolatopsis sp. cmx-11-51 TaxID=2785797 RepID=UPI0039E2ACDB
MARVDAEEGAPNILVNDIYGAPIQGNKTVCGSTLDTGLRTLRLAISLPLMIRNPGALVTECNSRNAHDWNRMAVPR